MAVQGKVVIITGAAMGIGRYNARLFAAEGARLALMDIAPMDAVIEEVVTAGAEVLPIQLDIRDEDQVKAAIERVHTHYGRIDVLINDAAIVTHFQAGSPRWAPIREMESSFFENIMRTNLTGTFHCTKHVLTYMEAQRSGHIINFGQGNVSNDRIPDSPGACVYHISKVSIRAFTKEVAEEEREFGICIMSMGPGGGGNAEAERGRQEGRRAIATDETPVENREHMVWVADVVEDRYVIAAEAPMEFTGNQVMVQDGALVITSD